MRGILHVYMYILYHHTNQQLQEKPQNSFMFSYNAQGSLPDPQNGHWSSISNVSKTIQSEALNSVYMLSIILLAINVSSTRYIKSN